MLGCTNKKHNDGFVIFSGLEFLSQKKQFTKLQNSKLFFNWLIGGPPTKHLRSLNRNLGGRDFILSNCVNRYMF